MNLTRIIGPNNKIYQKFGDYCISEADNECCIVCCFCQEEHQCEDIFWTHMRTVHDYTMSRHLKTLRMADEINSLPTSQGQDFSPTKVAKDCPNSPMYVEAEYLEKIPLNDPKELLKLCKTKSNAQVDKDKRHMENICDIVCSPNTPAPKSAYGEHKYIDVESISSKLLSNGKVIKRIFQQMHRANIEFKYKLNKLTQTIRTIELEMQRDSLNVRKPFMKVIPDKPLTSREEVLILDDELHKSKNMRDCFLDEALAIVAENAEVYARVLWRFIMTDKVSNQFCWRGVIDGNTVVKYPIKDTTIMDIFQEAFREKFPEQPIHFFKERTMTYFNKANGRIKRSRILQCKQQKPKSCDIDNDDKSTSIVASQTGSNNDSEITDSIQSTKRQRTSDGSTESMSDTLEEVFR